MASAFAWLDSSEHERRRALDVIDLFGQSETVDELGLGTVRDTIADVLSAGTESKGTLPIPGRNQRGQTPLKV